MQYTVQPVGHAKRPLKGIFIYVLIKKMFASTHSQKGSLANSIVKELMQISKVSWNFFKLDYIYVYVYTYYLSIKINMSFSETQNWSK